ncbi:MAG: aminoacyl-tRNA hydrolase [Spirochaetes bacterium]|nr:aminoacyl-tRNA hydrolase [Spirochaetota bacterium]
MKIIACLGNPGKKYAGNRHNAGMIAGLAIAKIYTIDINKKEHEAITGSGTIEGHDCLFVLPQTYMNNSGIAVQKVLSFYKETPDNLIVLHDEIELQFGHVKLKFGGGHKGHNGIRSIQQHLGTPDFYRIRIGVGRPNDNTPVADYVLSDFSYEEKNHLHQITDKIHTILVEWLKSK